MLCDVCKKSHQILDQVQTIESQGVVNVFLVVKCEDLTCTGVERFSVNMIRHPVKYKLYLDDIRPCPDGFFLARSVWQAQTMVKYLGVPSFISFDHDLGNEDVLTGMYFANWLTFQHIEESVKRDNSLEYNKNYLFPDDFSFFVHSANPVGAKNIQSKMDNFMKYLKGD